MQIVPRVDALNLQVSGFHKRENWISFSLYLPGLNTHGICVVASIRTKHEQGGVIVMMSIIHQGLKKVLQDDCIGNTIQPLSPGIEI